MDTAYENAVRTIAESYEQERSMRGGRSLARIATIIVNNGAFFKRVADGKPFSVTSLEKIADWFRRPANWPDCDIPAAAESALISIGRPPVHDASMPHAGVPILSNVAPIFDRDV